MPWETLSEFSASTMAPIARGHEIAHQLLSDPNIVAALGALAANPSLRAQAAADPLAFAKSWGIILPADSTVSVRLFRKAWEVEITVEEGGYTYTNGFNSSRGFYHR